MTINKLLSILLCVSILLSLCVPAFAADGEGGGTGDNTLGGSDYVGSGTLNPSQTNQTVADLPSAAPSPPADPNITVTTVLAGVNQIISMIVGIATLAQFVTGSSGNTSDRTLLGYSYTTAQNTKALLQGFQQWFNPTTGNLGKSIVNTGNYLSQIKDMLARLNNSDYSTVLSNIYSSVNSQTSLLATIANNALYLSSIRSDTSSLVTSNNQISGYSQSIDSKLTTTNSGIITISGNISDIETNTNVLPGISSSVLSVDTKLTSINSNVGGISTSVSNILNSIGLDFDTLVSTALDGISDNQDTQEGTLEDISGKLDDIIDVVSNPADQQVTQNQHNNVNVIIPTFFTGVSTDTSLGPGDWSNLGSLLRKLRNFLSSGVSLAGFTAALDEASDEGTEFFSEAVLDDLYNAAYLGAYVP